MGDLQHHRHHRAGSQARERTAEDHQNRRHSLIPILLLLLSL
jgi:hypothetical protein